ncbi:DUF2164 domain-containing protein [Brevibacillus composti]|uniref:DUF2164 domain-containing protein n=1 Tax=Brevibacillus composti TaxID=2796470 RepID=A0A7T5JMW3_9BACL|nr:DUF2164 domain-containing protein [Brevibacillus composti]QQE73395.1 DUF2164 domain-containing protein [Brevibacillus composti]QUO40476.1 DUF2164 domain-containing protein [Brevibacillus composti]
MKMRKFPREQREYIISQIQQYFQEERGEELGHLAAEQMLDFFLKTLGPVVYNQAVDDCRKLMLERMSALEDELYSLEQPLMPYGGR